MTTGDAIQTIAAITAAIGVVYAAKALALSQRVARSQFWLALRDQFARHDETHRKLRPGGEWAESRGGPATANEWAAVEAYMGLLEHCERMMEEDVLDERTFVHIYSYRLGNIVDNAIIRREKLVERRDGWTTFLKLVHRAGLDADYPELRPVGRDGT